MSTYTQILYHVVFGTKGRAGTLDQEHHDPLWRYITGVLRNKECKVYIVGGYTNHVHILTSLHPALTLADLVKDVKLAVTKWNKDERRFPAFAGWQEGYGAFTCSYKDQERISSYIRNQYEHHLVKTFEEELEQMLRKAGVEYDRKYM